MTSRIGRQLLATATSLVLLAASSSAFAAPPSIAPFTLKIKSKIYTFAVTASGYTFFGFGAYVPGPQFYSTGSGYLSGPVAVHIPASWPTPSGSPGYPAAVSSSYAFNPYWGAKHAPGISSGQAAAGTNPFITNAAATAVLGSNAPPDFTVGAGQMHWTGSGTVPGVGAYLGTTSTLAATNGPFDLGHGKGPGTQTFTAGTNFGQAGQVKFTQGIDNPNGFGGTIDMLGGTKGTFLTTESVCASGATSCYHLNLFTFPAVAAHNNLSQNQWTGSAPAYFVNNFGATKTTQLTGTVQTALTTHKVTTGKVIMSQTDGSYPTIITETGSDARTAAGVGNITLVTGWLGHTVTSGTSHWGGSTVFKFTFFEASETPSLAGPGLGALGGLMAIGAVYVIRKRGFNS